MLPFVVEACISQILMGNENLSKNCKLLRLPKALRNSLRKVVGSLGLFHGLLNDFSILEMSPQAKCSDRETKRSHTYQAKLIPLYSLETMLYQ